MPNIELLFPSVLYNDVIKLEDQWIEDLKKEKFFRSGLNNGWITNPEIHKKKKYEKLMSLIDHHVNIYVRDVMKITKAMNFSCSGAWVNRHSPGDWAQDHKHSWSFLSGIVYLDVPLNSGEIIFSENMPRISNAFGSFFSDMIYDETTMLNATNVSFNPIRDTIYIFPSTLVHSVPKNNSNKSRYSLAFDYIPVGKIKTISNEITITV